MKYLPGTIKILAMMDYNDSKTGSTLQDIMVPYSDISSLQLPELHDISFTNVLFGLSTVDSDSRQMGLWFDQIPSLQWIRLNGTLGGSIRILRYECVHRG